MELQKQVCSLELAKQLKELGLKQESLFYWFKTTYYNNVDEYVIRINQPAKWSEQISAFTVGELGEILKDKFNEWSQGWNNSGCFWHFQYGSNGSGNMIEGIGEKFSALDEETEADARAAMLIYLIENDLLTPTPRTNASDGLDELNS